MYICPVNVSGSTDNRLQALLNSWAGGAGPGAGGDADVWRGEAWDPSRKVQCLPMPGKTR